MRFGCKCQKKADSRQGGRRGGAVGVGACATKGVERGRSYTLGFAVELAKYAYAFELMPGKSFGLLRRSIRGREIRQDRDAR